MISAGLRPGWTAAASREPSGGILDDRGQAVAELAERGPTRGHPGRPGGGDQPQPSRRPARRPRRRWRRTRPGWCPDRPGRARGPGPRRPRPAVRPGRGSGRPARRARRRAPVRIALASRSASPVTNAASWSCTPDRLNGAANGRRCRSCPGPSSESMLGPDDPGRREAGVVDGEGRTVPHDRRGQVPPGHQPAVQHRHPGDGLGLAQPGQRRMRVLAQLGQGDGRAARILAGPVRHDLDRTEPRWPARTR